MTSTEIFRLLRRNGFEVVRQKGSHMQIKNAQGRLVTVPHPKRDIPEGTLRSIERQAGLKLR